MLWSACTGSVRHDMLSIFCHAVLCFLCKFDGQCDVTTHCLCLCATLTSSQSSDAVSLAGKLELLTHQKLSPAVLYEYYTIDALANYLVNGHASKQVEEIAQQTNVTQHNHMSKLSSLSIVSKSSQERHACIMSFGTALPG